MSVLVAAGVKRVINNRPNGEEAGQPTSVELEAAALTAGLQYLWIPIGGFPSPAEVTAVGDALSDDVPTVLFCRSGMRSAAVWAMAERRRGADPDALRRAASDAGYDLSRVPL